MPYIFFIVITSNQKPLQMRWVDTKSAMYICIQDVHVWNRIGISDQPIIEKFTVEIFADVTSMKAWKGISYNTWN